MIKGAFDEAINLVTMSTEPRFYSEPLLWVFVIGGIIIVPIVMFNLLIAVIEQVFMYFEENRSSEELKVVAVLCLEIEYFMLFFKGFYPCMREQPLYLYNVAYTSEKNKKPSKE